MAARGLGRTRAVCQSRYLRVVFTPVRRTFCATSEESASDASCRGFGFRSVVAVAGGSGGVTEAAPVVGMNTTLRQQLLQQIITIIRQARPLVAAIERKDRDLGGQLKRSLNSIALNVAEAFGVHAGNARLSFRRALGELYESQATFQVAAAWGYITEQQAQAVASDLAVLGGRLYGLSRR